LGANIGGSEWEEKREKFEKRKEYARRIKVLKNNFL